MISHRAILTRRRFTVTALCLAPWLALVASGPAAPAEDEDQLLQRWLQTQTNLISWSADVTQTRSLKSLRQPLVSQGRVWYVAPNLFRWEIGRPPGTIALRQPAQMLVLYPKLKRAERYRLDDGTANPWKETLALLESGFPRSRDDLLNRFRIRERQHSGDLFHLTLQPRSPAARRMMPELKIIFSTTNFLLQATELTFTDGSKMRNDFSAPQINPKLDPELFTPRLPGDYTVVDPLDQ